MGQITRVTKGERPTLLEETKANEVIDAINALQNVTIEKADQDKVYVTSSGVKIYYKGGSDSDSVGSGVDANMIAIGYDGKIAYDLVVRDGIVDSFQEYPDGISLGTGGRYLMVDGTNHLQAKELSIENGFVTSVISKPSSFQGMNSWIELQDPTNISRTIRLLIRNGLISQITSGTSNFEQTPLEVCVDGVNQTKSIISYNENTQPQPVPGYSDLLNDFYTKHEVNTQFLTLNAGDSRYMEIGESYTKQESNRIFINGLNPPYYTKQQTIDKFVRKDEAEQKFVKKVDLAGDLSDLEDRIKDLENSSSDFFTKSEVEQIINGANSQINQLGGVLTSSSNSLNAIFASLKLTFESMKKQSEILEEILEALRGTN